MSTLIKHVTQCTNFAGRSFRYRAFSSTPSACTSLNWNTIGIRRENKGRWERRAPLSPEHVRFLVDQGVSVYVQPSDIRVYSNREYEKVGAKLVEDLSPAATILGVKEIPADELMNDRTHFFFSHTFKAQEYNMAMLDSVLEKKVRLIDYERMTNDRGERIVKFGRFAGVAGMMDVLNGLGNKLLGMGYHTPFLYIGLARNYPDLGSLRGAVRALGNEIAKNGVPEPLMPFVCVFTGNGAVSKGAQEVFNELPHRYVSMEEMQFLVESGQADRHIAYGVVAEPRDYMRNVKFPSGRFDKLHYYNHPEDYVSTFHYTVAPYASMIVNCMYWEAQYSRILTTSQMKELCVSGRSRLLALADITADPGGSIEFMSDCTTIDDPFFVYNAATGTKHKDMTGDGVLIMSVDNLPAELPMEASSHFGGQLLPYIQYYLSDPHLVKENVMSRCLKRAAETSSDGELTADYKYIANLREENKKNLRHVVLFGSGMVAGPVVDYLLNVQNIRVTIAGVQIEEANKLARGRDNVSVLNFNVSNCNETDLNQLIGGHDVAISLVPAPLHPKIAEACISAGTHLVTASYVSEQMQHLHHRACEKGVLLLNEIGLDPGIDHLSAMKVIDEVKDNGGKVTSFVSWCGGLPAPECSENALGYKFSWSPRGVLTAGLNAASFLKQGEMMNIRAGELYQAVDTIPVGGSYKGYALEGLPNRNSMPYADEYGIKQSAHTMFRGTLRFKGYSKVMYALARTGLMNQDAHAALQAMEEDPITWGIFMKELALGADYGDVEDWIQSEVTAGLSDNDKVIAKRAMLDLGLLSDDIVDVSSPTPLDALCGQLQTKLAYNHGERDMTLLQHEFEIENANGAKERRTSTLINYGDGFGIGDSAMAKTVGFPVGIATRLILDGQIDRVGVWKPTTPDFYIPILEELEQKGIPVTEREWPL
eukprot:CFRG7426T1